MEYLFETPIKTDAESCNVNPAHPVEDYKIKVWPLHSIGRPCRFCLKLFVMLWNKISESPDGT